MFAAAIWADNVGDQEGQAKGAGKQIMGAKALLLNYTQVMIALVIMGIMGRSILRRMLLSKG